MESTLLYEALGKMIEMFIVLATQDPQESALSAREIQRRNLEERIAARKTAVQNTKENEKDLELKNLRYNFQVIEEKMKILTEDKETTDQLIMDQEFNIREQQELIIDYTTQIETL
jgi:hypothetical protein